MFVIRLVPVIFSESHKLGLGVIIGIVAGAAVLIGVIVAVAKIVGRHHRRLASHKTTDDTYDNTVAMPNLQYPNLSTEVSDLENRSPSPQPGRMSAFTEPTYNRQVTQDRRLPSRPHTEMSGEIYQPTRHAGHVPDQNPDYDSLRHVDRSVGTIQE